MKKASFRKVRAEPGEAAREIEERFLRCADRHLRESEGESKRVGLLRSCLRQAGEMTSLRRWQEKQNFDLEGP